MQNKTNNKFKRLIDYFKHPNALLAIKKMMENEQKRYKNRDYNGEGIDDVE